MHSGRLEDPRAPVAPERCGRRKFGQELARQLDGILGNCINIKVRRTGLLLAMLAWQTR
jgi:hypothetical protein